MDNYIDIWFLVTAAVFALSVLSALGIGCWGKSNPALFGLTGGAFLSGILFFSQTYQIRTILAEELHPSSFVIESDADIGDTQLLDALTHKRYVTTNRTRPLSKRKVRIAGKHGEIELLVAEDSDNRHIFWVYYPKYRYSRINEIGKIRLR
ncbi:hypothetical protein ACK1CN_20340 [Vibrio coralliilyticus]|uniref:hypothetical protein n=1 Tax=Vibrio coralliilyticus TaxID=190893 RepID=UPI0039173A9C